jgi:hypothetical protein
VVVLVVLVVVVGTSGELGSEGVRESRDSGDVGGESTGDESGLLDESMAERNCDIVVFPVFLSLVFGLKVVAVAWQAHRVAYFCRGVGARLSRLFSNVITLGFG